MARPPGHGPAFEGRRNEIIDIAAQLFAVRGYTATGTQELCRATGLAGKGALYNYIGSKEKLLVEIQQRVHGPLLESSAQIEELREPALVRLRLLSGRLMSVVLSRLDHIWVYEHDYRHLTGENRSDFRRSRKEFEAVIKRLLVAINEECSVSIDTDLATLQFLNLHNHTYQWARPGMPWTAADLSVAYFTTLMVGLGVDVDLVEKAKARATEAYLDLMR